MTCDILIKNISQMVQVRTEPTGPLRGLSMSELPALSDAWLAVAQGSIADFGTMDTLPPIDAEIEIDARDRFVFPSFVDSHSHLIFADSREDEFVMKIKGLSYAEIAARGGGIHNSARKLQQMPEDELYLRTLPRVEEIIRTGTGAVEIKSGYGLTLEDELKMLRVARRIGRESKLAVRTTFLGAHAVPLGLPKETYVRQVIDEMIPVVAAENLADYIDVFCEHGFFSAEDTERILAAGLEYGMKGRVHANQLSRSGGVEAGIRQGALSVDHLESTGDEEIEALAKSDTIATALPGAAFFLGLPFPPVRRMIDAGIAVAIASDYNPGSSPTGNMPLMVSLACIRMKMTPEEAFNAATINTAAALELSDTHGSITKGKVANLFITRPMASLAFMPYAFGTAMVDKVILKGQLC